MKPSKVLPLTVMTPSRPLTNAPIARFLSAFRKSEPASGGKAPGMPSPLAWWQATQFAAQTRLPKCDAFLGSGGAHRVSLRSGDGLDRSALGHVHPLFDPSRVDDGVRRTRGRDDTKSTLVERAEDGVVYQDVVAGDLHLELHYGRPARGNQGSSGVCACRSTAVHTPPRPEGASIL